MDIPAAKQNRFSEKVDDESDYELSDGEINKILIITPHRPKKHDGWVNHENFPSGLIKIIIMAAEKWFLTSQNEALLEDE